MNSSQRSTHTTRRNVRNKILVGAIAAALALGAAGTVSAQSTAGYTLVPPGADWTQTLQLLNYLHSVNNTQTLSGDVTSTLGVGNDSVFINYAGSGQPQTLTGNTLTAFAGGNSTPVSNTSLNPNAIAGNYIQMELLGADGGGNSGLGVLSGQLNTGNAISADASNASAFVDLTGYSAGTVTNSDNAIRATTVMNDASSAVTGNLPAATFAGTTPGTTALSYVPVPGSPTLGNQGDITVGNAQVNTGTTGSGANVDNASIRVTDSVGSSASFTNSNNAIASSYTGNRGSSVVNATGSNGAPSYNGSVVVSSAQGNLNAPSANTMSGDVISTDVNGNLTGSGSVTQSGDSISASSQGNTASNAINFADGLNIDGTDPGTASTLSLAFAFGVINSSASGDLVLFNGQGNQGGAGLSSTVDGGSGITVEATSVSVAGTSVTLNDDHVTASTGGNAANNAIRTNGSSFSGFVAAGNQQANDGINLGSSTDGVTVQSHMTGAGNDGNISVSASSIAASVQGNSASTNADVAGTSFTSGGGVATADTTFAGGFITDSSTNAGVSVGNVQANYGGNVATITASNAGSKLAADYDGSITSGASTVDGNSIVANAGGNAAATSARLSGTNGDFSAALFNSQYINYATISGSTSGAFLGIDAASTVANASLTANGNTLGASANGNDGTNTLATDFTNASAGDGAAWAADSATVSPNGAFTPNSARGTLALASNQATDGTDFSAQVTDSTMGVAATGNVSNTPTTVNANATSAAAVANRVSNTVDPGVGNLAAVGNVAAQVATLSNYQFAESDDVSAAITLAGIPALATGAMFGGSLTGSSATVSDNTESAFVAGTMASNAMAINGTNYAPGAALPGGGGIDHDGLTDITAPTATAAAAFTVMNIQGSNGGSRSSTVTNGGIGAVALGNVTSSPLTVGDNQISADARDNYASNSLSFNGFSTLTTTAALVSGQIAGGTVTSVTSAINDTYVAAGSLNGNVAGSDVTVSGNSVSSKAIANTAINNFAVTAGNLAGSSFINAPVVPQPADRGAVINTTNEALILADFGLSNLQYRVGTVDASINGGGIGAGAGGNFSGNANGGSLTVAGNSQLALAQSNSSTNVMGLDVTSVEASAAMFNLQTVYGASDASASINTDAGFAAYVGGALGAGAFAVPTTVSDNMLIAQAGLNTATTILDVRATSAIDGTGVTTVGASTDRTRFGYSGAIADYAVYSYQLSLSGANATAQAGLVGIEAAGGSIGNNTQTSGLTVSGNHVAAQASANNATNAIKLTGASSVNATTALNNTQSTTAATTISAATSDTTVGIYDDTAANINNSNLSVSDNSLSAGASGNSATNSIVVQPVALNAGFNQATEGSVLATGSTAGASNALLNSQSNNADITASVSDSNIGVNSGAPGANSPLLNSVSTVGGNSASATASGNSAGNQIVLASLSTGTASSALVSNQVNTGNISATVTNVHIGVNAGGNSSSPVTVSGNTISATAVGNSSSNHITIGN